VEAEGVGVEVASRNDRAAAAQEHRGRPARYCGRKNDPGRTTFEMNVQSDAGHELVVQRPAPEHA
jgi:hypothetical protein